MRITHHLEAATLMSFAAGALDQGLAVVVAAHLELCPLCRRELRRLEQVGGASLAEVAGVELAPDALEHTLTRLDDLEPQAGGALPPVPRVIDRLVEGGLAAVPWKRLITGIDRHRIALAPHGEVNLLRIAPSQRIPEHTHRGTELTLVLTGAFGDATGRYVAGDIAEHDGSVQHEPVVDASGECICLFAAEARLRFRGLARFLQPFFRI